MHIYLQVCCISYVFVRIGGIFASICSSDRILVFIFKYRFRLFIMFYKGVPNSSPYWFYFLTRDVYYLNLIITSTGRDCIVAL